jgi:hypothetical protein
VLSEQIVKLAVHKTTLLAIDDNVGPITAAMLEDELVMLNSIESKINRTILIKGRMAVSGASEVLEEELRVLEADLLEDWGVAASIDYLRTFIKKVPADVFFEALITGSREALLGLQVSINFADTEARKSWLTELAELKKGNIVPNNERILALEGLLNEASERLIHNKINNFLKTDVLNSEKMTPLFLRLAQVRCSASLDKIKDDNGIPFNSGAERDKYITDFYISLYKIPQNARVDFTNCVENFLGPLTNHPAVLGCKLTQAERDGLEVDITVEELDEAVAKCNGNSAPGIDGIGNRFIKKF